MLGCPNNAGPDQRAPRRRLRPDGRAARRAGGGLARGRRSRPRPRPADGRRARPRRPAPPAARRGVAARALRVAGRLAGRGGADGRLGARPLARQRPAVVPRRRHLGDRPARAARGRRRPAGRPRRARSAAAPGRAGDHRPPLTGRAPALARRRRPCRPGGRVGRLGLRDPARARRLGEAMLAPPSPMHVPLRTEQTGEGVPFHVRASCCLYHRVPGAQVCAGCPLRRSPRLRAAA